MNAPKITTPAMRPYLPMTAKFAGGEDSPRAFLERCLASLDAWEPTIGAFVSLTPTKDGLVHISKLGGNIRLRRVEDVINQGDALQVEVTDIDPMGKISLVPVELPPRVAELPADYAQGEPRDRGGDRGDRGGRGGDRDRGRGGPRGPRREGSREGGRDRERTPRSEGE